MEIAKLVLEFLKVLLSPQCIAGLVAVIFLTRFRDDLRGLLGRIASIRLPGGAELATPQLKRAENEREEPAGQPRLAGVEPVTIPEGLHLTPEQAATVGETFRAERAKAFLWEYRYLNYFLVQNTQRVLDWLAGLKERTTVSLYEAWWLPLIPRPEERRAILAALEAHYLIEIQDGELIEVTPKGLEYLQWRGPLPDRQT
jgi:hypothetical protein